MPRVSAARRQPQPIIVGIDTGGTFTDFVALIEGQLRVEKVPSTPHDPAVAVFEGLKRLLGARTASRVTYGSTVATNALLERKGARVALFTNAGFEDLIEIGRQNRSDIYALAPQRPEPLVERRLRYGVKQRAAFDGTVLTPLQEPEIERLVAVARRSRAQAFVVCLLHSYANPADEQALGAALGALNVPVSISSRLLPEYREFERLSTAVINAYVAPRMAAHLTRLERELGESRLRVMQSDGKAIGADLAREEPVRTILSGPAAGVIGCSELSGTLGVERFITFDMGGTSTDVSLYDGRPNIRSLSYPLGYPVKTPVIDIHTVGAGGGSIARIDAGGSLKVGPQSAGAEPGPACYGRGSLPTVTDANLVAGRLVASHFLGGRMRLNEGRAQRALSELGRSLGASAVAAEGVIRIVNANMERAIRLITVARGHDPRHFALVAFGGAGPMHGCELAQGLGIGQVILPSNPGLLCAWGALTARVGREYSLTVRRAQASLGDLLAALEPLRRRARSELMNQGISPNLIRERAWADVRYRGQSYELRVALRKGFVQAFHRAHRATFGYAAPEGVVEVVNLALEASAAGSAGRPPAVGRGTQRPVPIAHGEALIDQRRRRLPIYDRQTLRAGVRLRGPMLVVELSATTFVSPEFTLRVDDHGNLHLEVS